MSKTMNFFDGDISKADITNALSRILVLLIAIVTAFYIFSIFQDSSTQLDLKSNPYYLIAQNENLSQSTRLEAMNELSKMAPSQVTASFGKRLFQTLMMLFALTISSSLIAFTYTKIKWTVADSVYIEPSPKKIIASIIIFATVFVAGSIIFVGLNL